MTIKINVGVNKKIGLPDYGSAGSHCVIELEADNSVLDNADLFLQRVKNAYEMARASVEEELAHHRPANAGRSGGSQSGTQSQREPEQQQRQEYRQEYRNENRSDNRNDNSSDNRYIASAKQQQFIASLVKAVKGLDWRKLDKYCETKFGRAVSQLSSKEASQLIDDLQAAKSGRGGLQA